MRHGITYRCASLVVTGDVGQPHATHCAQYATRVDGMPILMLAEVRVPETPAFLLAQCGKDSWDETLGILPHIGQGCSLWVT